MDIAFALLQPIWTLRGEADHQVILSNTLDSVTPEVFVLHFRSGRVYALTFTTISCRR
jgi:hypothetical protein